MTILLLSTSFFKKTILLQFTIETFRNQLSRVQHRIAPEIRCELFSEVKVPYNLPQDVSFRSYNVKTVRRCHTPNLKFGIWFLLTSEIARQNKFFTKTLKSENQIDIHLGSAKYRFLIQGLLIKNSATQITHVY